MKKYIDVEALINMLTIDPYECPGCPEPEGLEELIDMLYDAPDADVIELNREYSLDDYEVLEKHFYSDDADEPERLFVVKRRDEGYWTGCVS